MDRKEIIKELQQFKQSVNKEFPITSIYFFGSRAYGKPHKYSDIDLLIVSPHFSSQRSIKRGIGLYKHWSIDLPVDFICITPEEFTKASQEPTIVREAVERGVFI